MRSALSTQTLLVAGMAAVATNAQSASFSGTIYFTTQPQTYGAPLYATVSGSTAAAVFTNGGATYEATAVSGGGVVFAGYTLSPGGPPAQFGGTIISAASDGLVVGSATASFSSGGSAGTLATSSSTSYKDGETSVAVVASSESASRASASAESTSTSSAGALAKATDLPWTVASAAAMGGIAGVMAFL